MLPLIIASIALGPLVCIDPGHPSEIGRGTAGKRLTELHANWTEALLLKKELETRGVRVVMTKTREEQFVANQRRAEIANRSKAAFMVRLHCDSASGTGFTTFYPQHAGTVRGRRGPSPSVLNLSRLKARAFHDALAKELAGSLVDNGLKGDQATHVGARHGALIASVFSEVPVVLVEMVVLSNPKDEGFLRSKLGMRKMARALSAATMAALRTH